MWAIPTRILASVYAVTENKYAKVGVFFLMYVSGNYYTPDELCGLCVCVHLCVLVTLVYEPCKTA